MNNSINLTDFGLGFGLGGLFCLIVLKLGGIL